MTFIKISRVLCSNLTFLNDIRIMIFSFVGDKLIENVRKRRPDRLKQTCQLCGMHERADTSY